MKKILVGFEQPKLIREITKYVQETNSEELSFVTRRTKGAVLSEIADGGYDVVLLMEECGSDIWSMDEFIQIKDSYSINLIPVIPEAYKGGKELVTFCNYGITSAVFIRKKGIYKADEIFRMIYNPRTLKEARIYYGVATVSDSRSGGSVLDEVVFEQARNAILDDTSGKPIGERFIDAISNLTPAQVGDLIKRLDDESLNRLRKTVEFYDVLGILKQHRVIRSYHVPKEIKQQQKHRGRGKASNDAVAETENGSIKKDLQFESDVVIDVSARDVVTDEDGVISYEDGDYEEELDIDEFQEDEEDISFSEESQHVDKVQPHEGNWEEDEFEFSFAPEMQVEKVAEQEIKKGEELRHTAISESGSNQEKNVRKRNGLGDLDSIPEETGSENRNITANIIRVGIAIAGTIFFLVLVFLFVKITIQRHSTQSGVNTSGYDTLYASDESGGYELTDGGDVPLNEEENPQGRNGSGTVTVPEEEIDFSVVNEADELDIASEQAYNDTSAFDDGVDYKGLDLVNMLNGTQGADCVLCLKNGATVSVTRGNASIEDFKPSGSYRCKKTDSELKFVEK